MNRQYLDPVFRGEYPAAMSEIFGDAWPDLTIGNLPPIDFLGVNYYTRGVTRYAPREYPLRAVTVHQPRSAYTETGWEVYPDGLADTLRWVAGRYGPIPLYVTENGAAFYDPPSAGSSVNDPLRVEYVRSHLRSVRRAIEDGVDVRGYFAWSLLDNFEWAHGYSKRFGLVHVDYATQARTPKSSARFYAEVIRTHGASLAE
jgi:beta-glucosidase